MSLFLTFLLLLTTPYTQCIYFQLKAGGTKCLRHDSPKGVITNGFFTASEAAGQQTNLVVKDLKGHILYKKDNIVNGTFACSTEEYDVIEACFTTNTLPGVNPSTVREVMLDMKQGAEAKNFDMLAKAEKLKPMEGELKKLEALAEEILRDFGMLHDRSEKMRSTNESTHSRVLYFSVLSMLILIGFACWQVLYLRRYFKCMKLIE